MLNYDYFLFTYLYQLGYRPRLAAMTIVRLVNSKRVNQAMLALTVSGAIMKIFISDNSSFSLYIQLLDHCVKNCGYPFHLQIATKEFLNALVRKFPERPPASFSPAPPPRLNGSPDFAWNHFDYVPQQPSGANPIMARILYLIKEWKVGLAELSRYKNDLIHIKDMYRLLRYKGYRFPEIREASLSALAPVEVSGIFLIYGKMEIADLILFFYRLYDLPTNLKKKTASLNLP